MLFQAISYCRFLLQSTNRHGVHSPFVYDLITSCFNDSLSKKYYKKLNGYRDSLLNDETVIEINDFGAGSKSLKNNSRKVRKIAANAGITKKRGRLLARLVNYFEPKNILEIGTSLGISTACLSVGSPESKIITLEGCKNTAAIAQSKFDEFDLRNIDVIIGNFDETLPAVLENKTFDFIYFDGNHQKEPTINYFEKALMHAHNGSIFIFDDIYWSKGMFEAWTTIKGHPRVTVSIDTFHWGIVFFRKEQEKQHFTIRI